MSEKAYLRKKFFLIRKKKYFEIKPIFFNPLVKLVKKKINKRKLNLSCYYPSSFEVNVFKLFDTNFVNRLNILLPVVSENNLMHFYKWKLRENLKINKFGILEPLKLSKHIIPDVMLVPLLAFDNRNNRLGYGKGYYDRYLCKYLRKHKNILTIGIAFSFQRYHKLPVSTNDIRLNYILTERGIF